ncbi:hypothetical protein [Streptomyces fungicidicus]|uniref:hypothetical protein n=1 Tax=Streptomyces fungicidicus TaxID=68203 RepID=UPI003D73DF1C
MKIRKALAATFGTLAMSLISISPASADSSGWQNLGNSNFHSCGTYCHTDVFSSGGGYVRTYLYTPSSNIKSVQVWEYDPDNADDFIITLDLADYWYKDCYVGNFTDGSNGEAEIYYRYSDSVFTGGDFVQVYD